MIEKNTNYTRMPEFTYEPEYTGVNNDYSRYVMNHTGEDISITDASGRVVKHSSLSRPKHSGMEKVIVIEEWFRGTDTTGMVDVNEEYEGFYTPAMGVKLRYVIRLADLAEVTDGLFIEECNLVVCLTANAPAPVHPRFASSADGIMSASIGLHLGVELLDPRKAFKTLYANIGGVVYPIAPKRHPTPESEGIMIHRRDSSKGTYESKLHQINELLEGPGIHGIRLYFTEQDAMEDVRQPDRAGLAKTKKQLIEEREAIYKEGVEAGKKAAIEEAAKIEKQADEKLKKAEDVSHKAREDRHADSTGLWAGVIKVVSSVIGFFKSIFT